MGKSKDHMLSGEIGERERESFEQFGFLNSLSLLVQYQNP